MESNIFLIGLKLNGKKRKLSEIELVNSFITL